MNTDTVPMLETAVTYVHCEWCTAPHLTVTDADRCARDDRAEFQSDRT